MDIYLSSYINSWVGHTDLVMDFIPILKHRRKALEDCAESEETSPAIRQEMTENLKVLGWGPWATKGLLLLGIVLGVNWKKQVPLTRR